jgi:indolepyruvate ferredoxin oxidoreductase
MELSPESVAASLGRFLGRAGLNLPAPPAPLAVERPDGLLRRIPAFCAGCPHATSTKLPDGSFSSAGIGCHFMALDESDQTRTFTQMGGEGAPFVGMAPFTDMPHVFANMGDGTYTHSGIMAIRQAAAAGTRMTYKLLVTDAVAMTAGSVLKGSSLCRRANVARRSSRPRASRARCRRRRSRPPSEGLRAAVRLPSTPARR